MKQSKKFFSILMVAFMVIISISIPVKAATPRTMLTYDVWGYSPSDRIDMKVRITVNDSAHTIIGTQGVQQHGWSPSVKGETIKWTSLNIAYDGSYAYCAVSYTTMWGEQCTETVKFYP